MKDINDIQSLRSFFKLVFSVSTLRRSDTLFKHSKDDDDVQWKRVESKRYDN